MLIGLVLLFATLAVGFGFVAFTGGATGGILWDLGFLASLSAFLACFVAVIWRHAEMQFRRDSGRQSESEGTGREGRRE